MSDTLKMKKSIHIGWTHNNEVFHIIKIKYVIPR